MAHLGRRLWDSASDIDLSQLPSASPSNSYHLNHSDSTPRHPGENHDGMPKYWILTHRYLNIRNHFSAVAKRQKGDGRELYIRAN